MRWRPYVRRSPIGLDIGGWNIKAVQLSESSTGRRVEAVARFGRAVPNGPLDLREMQRLTDVLYRRGFVGREVILTVPPDQLLSATMELPARNAAVSFDALARTEFARMQKNAGNDFEMVYWDLPAPSRANRATIAMACGCTHTAADALAESFAQVGLDVCGLDVRSWAMARACEAIIADATGIVAMLEMGRNSALLIAQHEGVIVYERTLEEASLTRLHATLMSELHLAADVAECVMSESGLLENTDPAGANSAATSHAWSGEAKGIITTYLDAIAKDVQASVAYIGNQYPEVPVQRLIVCGGGAMMPGLPDYLKTLLGVDVLLAEPLAAFAGENQSTRESSTSMTIATGLALYPWL